MAMKEEYCATCGTIIRFPENANKVFCESCETTWLVVRTGSMVNLAPVGSMQTTGQEVTLQKRLKDLARQAQIKEEHCRRKRREIDGIQVVVQPVPLPMKVVAIAVSLFFLVAAIGGIYFHFLLPVVVLLVALAASPYVGVWLYGKQINTAAREQLLRKKELIREYGQIMKEIEDVKAEKQRVARETSID